MAHFVNLSQETVVKSYPVGRSEHFVQESEQFFCEAEEYCSSGNSKKKEKTSKETSWWHFYHFSNLRRGILSWYPFEKNARLLELGAECGALTGVFCEKCHFVTSVEKNLRKAHIMQERYRDCDNLEILCCAYDSLEKIKVSEKYDYIVLNRIPEFAEMDISLLLQKLKSKFLKDSGIFLILADNKYAIRNFCGARNAITGEVFDAVNHYGEKKICGAFSRQELLEGIEKAGLKYSHFFYPLPNDKAAQVIYSDEYMQKGDLRNRVVCYEPQQDTLLAYEGDLYEDILDNNALPFLSNSFLVECSMKNTLSDIKYVTCSEDRGIENGMAIIFHANNVVEKRPLFYEGERALKQSKENAENLARRGLHTVCGQWKQNSLWMPYMPQKKLSSFLEEAAAESPALFWEKLERWYNDILRSSDSSERLDERFGMIPEDVRGIILKTAYIDMVPVNIFVDDLELIYFDQEFVWENIPAKFVFYRGIKYLYQSQRKINALIPLGEVKARYELNDVWDYFDIVEKNFIDAVRSRKEYSSFYSWTKFDRRKIRERAQLLEYQGEPVHGYKLSDSTKCQRRIQLELLDILIQVCEKEKLTYFMFYGSLLGTIRHEGYIPWDDDIDVLLPRADYNRLLEIADEVFKEPYFLQTPENNPDIFYGGYAKLRHSMTTGMEPVNWKHEGNQGIWIDVFALDDCYSDIEKNRIMWEKNHYIQQMLFAKVYDEPSQWMSSDGENWGELRHKAEEYTHEYLCEELEKSIESCTEEKAVYCAIMNRYILGDLVLFYKEDFSKSVEKNFEGLKVQVPIGYKRCLELLNGKRYMVYIKEENRKPRHKGLFSDVVPYNKYKERFDVNVNRKTAILLGEHEVIDFFCRKFRKKINQALVIPTLIDEPEKLENECREISIDEVKEFEDCQIVICAKQFVDYEERLQKKGVYDYHIFVSNRQHIIQKG